MMSPSLKLVFEHLNAVRELDRYLHHKGGVRDLEQYIKETFRPAVESRIPAFQLESWHCDSDETGAYWHPDSWRIDHELYVAIYVLLPHPLDPDDVDPSVNISVPEAWAAGLPVFGKRSTDFVRFLVSEGFGIGSEHDWAKELPIGKYVSWLNADGSFSESGLMDRIVEEVAKIVSVESEIAETIRQVAAGAAANGAGRRGRTTRK